MFLISLSLLFAVGFLTVAALLPYSKPGERLAMFLPFGMGVTTLMTWGLLSLELTVSRGSLTLLQAMTAAGLLFYVRRKSILEINPRFISFNKVELNSNWLIFILFVTGLVFNIFYPIVVSDGVGYKIIGKLMVGEQKILIHENWFPAGSQNRTLGFHLISGYFYLFGFNHPKIIQSIYYISLTGLFYVSIRRFINATAARGFTLLLATSPMIFWHSFLYLNNLSAGFYFFCGLLYWFYFLHFKDTRYLPLSSFAFMLAAWMRYESLVFYLIPLASICFWSLNNRKFKAPLSLLIFPSVFSVLWALYSVNYFPDVARTTDYLYLSLLLIVLNILLVLAHTKIVEAPLIWKAGAAIIICGAVFILTNQPLSEEIWKIFLIANAKFPIHVLNKIGWGSGIILALFIPFCYSAFSTSQKYLLFNLIFLMIGITLLLSFWSKTTPMLGHSLLYKAEFFFQTMTTRISRSSNRMAFILIPALFFFIGVVFCSNKAPNRTAHFLRSLLVKRSYFNGLNVLILGNLIAILCFFIYPRMEFLSNHIGGSREKILLSPGSRDNLNFFNTTYKIAYAIAHLTPPESTILMPYFFGVLTHTEGAPSYLSIFATTDVLYPRRIYWSKGTDRNVSQKRLPPVGTVYQVTHPDWLDNQCKDHPEGKPLGYDQWFICPALREVTGKLYSQVESNL